MPTKFDAAIFILSPDIVLGPEHSPRQNVIFELGMFHGWFGRQKTIILASGAVNLPTDTMGTIYLRYEPERLDTIAQQLRREFKNMGLI